MKATVIVALFVACIAGSALAQDCMAKFKDFHQCLEASHKKAEEEGKAKWEALKPKIDACYTDNGCTPPAKAEKGKGGKSNSTEGGKSKGGKSSGEKHGNSTSKGKSSEEKPGNKTQAKECKKAVREALKNDFVTCVQKTVPTFMANHTEPKKEGKGEREGKRGKEGHWGGWDHKKENKALEGCDKKEQVRDCKHALFNSSKPTQDERKARFQARCDAKQTCLTALGADCQAQLDKLKQATCQCRQDEKKQFAQVRAGVPACAGVPEKKPKEGGEKEEKPCEQKDFCKFGFDAFEQEEKARFEKNNATRRHDD